MDSLFTTNTTSEQSKFDPTLRVTKTRWLVNIAKLENSAIVIVEGVNDSGYFALFLQPNTDKSNVVQKVVKKKEIRDDKDYNKLVHHIKRSRSFLAEKIRPAITLVETMAKECDDYMKCVGSFCNEIEINITDIIDVSLDVSLTSLSCF